MAALASINTALTDAQRILDTWTANADFSMGDINLKQFTAARDEFAALSESIDTKRHELQGLLDDRDDQGKALRDLITRARSGFRAFYGPDSAQYDQAGGVRTSERKPRALGKKAKSAS